MRKKGLMSDEEYFQKIIIVNALHRDAQFKSKGAFYADEYFKEQETVAEYEVEDLFNRRRGRISGISC
jgi:hypothetical protein